MAVTTTSVAGIVAGRNPLEYSASSPYTVFLFQAVFIILFCQIVHYPLSKIRQPKVIAEVITGILLGPSVMGHIPKFTTTCFSADSITGLTLMANVGIILFLFIVGLEVDIGFIRKNFRVAISVGIINMAVPFGLGCAVARGLYNEYHPENTSGEAIKFTTFMVFIAVAMCITAFPVLARILTELNLLKDRVGTIVLAAGITNDLLGWILLALSVTLANAGNGVNTVYIILLALGWFLFMTIPVRITLRYCLTRFTRDLERGSPSQLSMMFILVMVFISAFYTDIIGVHPIFGAFIVGVIVPRDNGFVVSLTEKIEDLVNVVLIPLYFALAGLNTNLGLLNRGIDWAYVVAIIVVALVGKISGGFAAAKMNKLLWRESLSVGVLMSCKGIVEIVVLTTGLKAGIISQRVFSMFIVMALVTTFLTTPLTLVTYPVSYRTKVQRFFNGEINWDGTPTKDALDSDAGAGAVVPGSTTHLLTLENMAKFRLTRLVVVLYDLESVSNIMYLLHNLSFTNSGRSTDDFKSPVQNYDVDIHALHIKEFTERTSHLIQASTSTTNLTSTGKKRADGVAERRPQGSLLNVLKVFTELNHIHYSSQQLLSTEKNRPQTIFDNVAEPSDFVVTSAKASQVIESLAVESASQATPSSPGSTTMSEFLDGHPSSQALYRGLFEQARCHVGLLIKTDVVSAPARGSTEKGYESEDDEDVKFGYDYSYLGINHINLVLDATTEITKHDLLALHLLLKMAYNYTSLTAINIFLGYSADDAAEFNQLDAFVQSIGGRKVNVVRISNPMPGRLVDDVLDRIPEATFKNGLFVVANNVASFEGAVLDDNTRELVAQSAMHGFNVLAVRAFGN
ncbi:K(+)/H(+) antiporter [Dipodascopsis tothii]|uniref:K(+)/H(+) antiporter n=1 Tax=Dipodascopsis tothii TaxID=44089 RepID=UPI0034CE14EF